MTTARIHPGRPLRGEARVPGDKSITQRAILIGALASGVTRIEGANTGRDAAAALGLVRALGVRAGRVAGGSVLVRGGSLRESDRVLDARNSATALRLAAGLLAAQPFLSILTGDASLRRRPVARVLEPLRALGADVCARSGNRFPPVVVRGGPLRGAAVRTEIPSAQVKSAVLLAGVQASGVTSLREPVATRDHTERMLPLFGAPVEREGTSVRVRGPAPLAGAVIEVPGDFSAAAYLLAAAALVPRSDITIRGVGVNPTRTAFLGSLRAMGVAVESLAAQERSGEPAADLRVRASTLRPISLSGDAATALIDELPLLAVLAAFADGVSVIGGAGELRVKESDRISTVAAGLASIGVKVEEQPDGWVIHGRGRAAGGSVDAHGDHRVAMSFLIAGLRAKEGVAVRGAHAAAVSDPGFLGRLKALVR